MKKFQLILVIQLFFNSSILFSQNFFFYYGVRGGPNFSNLLRDPNFERRNYEMNMFYHAGMYINFTFRTKNALLDRMFAFQTDILYSQKGAERNLDGFLYRLKLHFIDVPLLAVFNIIDRFKGDRGLTFKIGGVPGYLIAAREITGRNLKTFTLQEGLKNYSFGLQAGAGAFVEDFTIEGKYEYGITDMNSVEGGPMVKHSIWIVALTFRLSNFGNKGSRMKQLKPLKDLLKD